jgi:fatty-acyl-CoA synthase
LKGNKPGQWSCQGLPRLKNLIYIGEGQPEGMYNWQQLYELGSTVSDAELAQIQASLDVHDVVNMQ